MRGWEPRIQRGDAAEKRAVRSSQAQVSATWPRSHTSTGPGHRCRLETRPGTLATRESRLLDDFPVTKPRPTPCEVSSFRGLIGLVCVSHHSCVRLRAAPRTVAHQAPPSRGFSRQEYWSRLPCPPPRELPYPGIELLSLTSPALAGGFFTASATWEDPGMSVRM